MQFTHDVPVPVPARAVDLGEWIFGMTDAEYRACARGHQAMGVIGGGRRLGVVNVESIAGTLIVQHYETRLARPDRVTFASPASEGRMLRLVPFTMAVDWDMQLSPAPDGTSSLRCTIGFQAPLWARAAGVFNFQNYFVKRHLVEETGGFARDLATKYGSRKSA